MNMKRETRNIEWDKKREKKERPDNERNHQDFVDKDFKVLLNEKSWS